MNIKNWRCFKVKLRIIFSIQRNDFFLLHLKLKRRADISRFSFWNIITFGKYQALFPQSVDNIYSPPPIMKCDFVLKMFSSHIKIFITICFLIVSGGDSVRNTVLDFSRHSETRKTRDRACIRVESMRNNGEDPKIGRRSQNFRKTS